MAFWFFELSPKKDNLINCDMVDSVLNDDELRGTWGRLIILRFKQVRGLFNEYQLH